VAAVAPLRPVPAPESACPECGRAVVFCERCGRAHPARRSRTIRSRLRALAGIQTDRANSRHPRARLLSSCPTCGRFVGKECWNPLAAHCLDCRPAPLFGGVPPVEPGTPLCGTCELPLPRPIAVLPGRVAQRPAGWVVALAGIAVIALLVVDVATRPRPTVPSPAAVAASAVATPTGGVAGVTATPPATPSPGPSPSPPAASPPSASPPPSPAASASPAAPTPTVRVTPAIVVVHSGARSWRDEFGSVFAHVMVEARNEGAGPVTVRGGDATYVVHDRAGNQLHRGAFVYALPAIVEPDATAWFVDTIRLDFASSTELGWVDAEVTPAHAGETDPSAPELTVSGVEWQRAGRGIEVAGRVVNDSDATVRSAVVAVVLLDRASEPLAVLYDATDVADLAPGDAAEFVTAHPETPPLDPASIGSVRSVAFVPPAP
jgi:hypothetical protein